MGYKTREKLIEVARQLFVHKGLENTTMNDIANASEKGRRTVYTYFKSKKEIYNAVLDYESDRMVAAMKEIAESNLGPELKFRNFLTLRLEQSTTISSPYSSLKSLFKFDLRRMERIRRMVLDKESLLLRSILDEGIAAGVFDPTRAELVSQFLIECISSMYFTEIDQETTTKLPFIQANFVEFIVSDLTYKTSSQKHIINPPIN